MEDQETQRQRQLLVENSTVSELGSLKHPFDIPMPKFNKKNRSTSRPAGKEQERSV